MRSAFFLLSTSLFLFLFTPKSSAESAFETQIKSSYVVYESYEADVLHEVVIKNRTEFTYAPFFTTEIEGEAESIEVLDENGNALDFESVEEEKNKIRVLFTGKNSGKGKTRKFTISYTVDAIAQEKGQLKEIYIPGLGADSQVSEKIISIQPPSSWGEPSIIKPQTFLKDAGGNYTFDKEYDLRGGVLIIFGNEQFYEVNLTYNLKNPNIFPAIREIALPPTTSYQDVVIKEINPYPKEMKIDNDGNWLAAYMIQPNETVTITAKLFIRTHMGKREFISDSQRKSYTKSDHYWETSSDEIKQLSKQLNTVRSISDAVVDILQYDYEKKSSDKKRYGAKESLSSNERAVCLEYTDLFVALSRSKDIPARSIEGYAYSDNPSTRPLSLVRDVLHAWPEYYDDSASSWKMIDPTWIDTTGGLDYFNSFDFDHIAFVIKGSSSRYPIPAGAYKLEESAKDIQVKILDKDNFKQTQQLVLTPHTRSSHFSLIPLYIDVTVRNSGDTIFEGGDIIFESSNLKREEKIKISSLAPGEEKNIRVKLHLKSILTKESITITMRFGGESSLLNIHITPYPPIRWIIVGGAISVIAAGFIIITRKTWNIHVPRRKRGNSLRG